MADTVISKRRLLAIVTGLVLLLLGIASLVNFVSETASAITVGYNPGAGWLILTFVWGAGLSFLGQWLLRRGGAPGFEAQTSAAFKLLGGGLILITVFAGGCALIFLGEAMGSDPYARIGVTIGGIVAAVSLVLGILFWKAGTAK